jgi:hypothetical protein
MSPNPLLAQFHLEMLATYDAALKLKPPYKAKQLLYMVGKHDGKETADRLRATSRPSSGFTELFLRGKENLKMSVEYLVLRDPWRTLFTERQLATARRRLREVECPPPPEDIA